MHATSGWRKEEEVESTAISCWPLTQSKWEGKKMGMGGDESFSSQIRDGGVNEAHDKLSKRRWHERQREETQKKTSMSAVYLVTNGP